MSNMTLHGGCLCGAIRYAVTAPVSGLRACHCTDCQKTSGTGSSVNAVVAGKDFALTQGKPKCYAAKAASGRTLSAPSSFSRSITVATSTSGAEAPAVTPMRRLPSSQAGTMPSALSTR